ncbi:YihY/virulence factor BrkB family protein [Halorubrum lacusprofundi]|uniref:Ribonuclease BN n=1 Tax=Halorubrum lacusprofundi (strain ATCC 49239 / DSM 5036 / JCM 8891 / ACAM 34) TaxID=416348 RepID=B9LSI8_HALLT|nr:YihY/virulence factor BrkB family protein [Halorubrum lacusprofundi]ACM57935.1 ribonuclease BN [Halorubrum lacusprofundi ATCC 49239]MCG1006911.1 YihY/virulence factor BrkB family protein [Halorubrum lacusprofundi]
MPTHSLASIDTVRRVVDVAIDRQVTFLAAAIAYYAFVSLIPALLLLVVVATAVFGEAIAVELLAAAGDFLTPAGQEAVAGAISSAGGRTGASVIGVAVLLWSTLKVFRGLDTAFAELYGVKEPPDFVKQLADAASVVLAVSVGIGVMVAIGAFVAAADVVPAVEAASILVLPAFLAVVFLPMYYLLPEPDIGLREALPGAAIAAVGWTLLQAGFQVYAASAGQFQVYGVIGGILLLVTWLYLAAVVVVVGGVVNVVLAGRDETAPASGAGLGGGPAIADAMDRQLQHDRDRSTGMNGESDGAGDAGDEERPAGAPDVAALQEEVSRLRTEFDAFEDDVERRTVDKPAVESELKRYVRSRMRRGHARGWGPYLVLLYGTVLILGAFSFLDGLYAIAAMLILGLSTLGLYTLFIIVGIGLNLLETPGKALDYARHRSDD